MEKHVKLKRQIKRRMSELKFIFGKPREGAHKFRIPIVDIAAVDLGLTLVVAYFLPGSFFFNSSVLLFLGAVVHRVVGVSTVL